MEDEHGGARAAGIEQGIEAGLEAVEIRREEGGVLGENGLLHPAQGRPGIEPEVIDQASPALGVRVEGLSLAAGSIQHQHEQRPAPLPVGPLGGKLPGVSHHLGRPTRVELARQELLLQPFDQLLEPGRDDPGFGQILEIDQRSPTTERQRRAEGGSRRLWVMAVGGATSLVRQSLDLTDIGRRLEHVAIVRRVDRQSEPAEAEDVRGDRVPSSRRRVVAPGRDLELGGIHRPAGIHRQSGEDAPLERPTGGDFDRAVPNDQWTEDANLHLVTLVERSREPARADPEPAGPVEPARATSAG